MSIFTRFGLPEELITDNGPQFTSQQFKDFISKYDIKHTTSSPYFPQANGLPERAVQTAKSILRQPDPQLALLSYRDTAIESTKESPARLLMGRRLRTTVPKLSHLLRPAWPDSLTVKRNDAKAKRTYEKTYNRRYSAKPLPAVDVGDRVRLKTDTEKEWSESEVVQEKPSDGTAGNCRLSTKNLMRLNQFRLQAQPHQTAVLVLTMSQTS